MVSISGKFWRALAPVSASCASLASGSGPAASAMPLSPLSNVALPTMRQPPAVALT